MVGVGGSVQICEVVFQERTMAASWRRSVLEQGSDVAFTVDNVHYPDAGICDGVKR